MSDGEQKGISYEKCSMCGGAFVYEIKVEEKPTEDGKVPPPGVIIFHEATHHIVAKWCPKCSMIGDHPQREPKPVEPEEPAKPDVKPELPKQKPEPYTGPFPKGTRVVLTELGDGDAKNGLKLGMRGVTIDSDSTPFVKLDKAPDPDDPEHCFCESQLTLEKDYDKGKRGKGKGGK